MEESYWSRDSMAMSTRRAKMPGEEGWRQEDAETERRHACGSKAKSAHNVVNDSGDRQQMSSPRTSTVCLRTSAFCLTL